MAAEVYRPIPVGIGLFGPCARDVVMDYDIDIDPIAAVAANIASGLARARSLQLPSKSPPSPAKPLAPSAPAAATLARPLPALDTDDLPSTPPLLSPQASHDSAGSAAIITAAEDSAPLSCRIDALGSESVLSLPGDVVPAELQNLDFDVDGTELGEWLNAWNVDLGSEGLGGDDDGSDSDAAGGGGGYYDEAEGASGDDAGDGDCDDGKQALALAIAAQVANVQPAPADDAAAQPPPAEPAALQPLRPLQPRQQLLQQQPPALGPDGKKKRRSGKRKSKAQLLAEAAAAAAAGGVPAARPPLPAVTKRKRVDKRRLKPAAAAAAAVAAEAAAKHAPPPSPSTSRRNCCQHCGAKSTPQWRNAPATAGQPALHLCNACGVRLRKLGTLEMA